MTSSYRQLNPRNPSLDNQYYDCDVTLTFDVQIQANAQLVGLQQPISSEGDFYLCAYGASSVIQQRPDLQELAGSVSIRLSDDTGYRLSDDYITMPFLTSIAGNPYPFVVKTPHLFKAGTKIWIDMQETSGGDGGSPSNVQIAFRGRYRYRMGG